MTNDPIARWEWEGGATVADASTTPVISQGVEPTDRFGSSTPDDPATVESDRSRRSAGRNPPRTRAAQSAAPRRGRRRL